MNSLSKLSFLSVLLMLTSVMGYAQEQLLPRNTCNMNATTRKCDSNIYQWEFHTGGNPLHAQNQEIGHVLGQWDVLVSAGAGYGAAYEGAVVDGEIMADVGMYTLICTDVTFLNYPN